MPDQFSVDVANADWVSKHSSDYKFSKTVARRFYTTRDMSKFLATTQFAHDYARIPFPGHRTAVWLFKSREDYDTFVKHEEQAG